MVNQQPDGHSDGPTERPPADGPGDRALDFIREIITEDLRTNRNGGRLMTRFPPEPNGYLHIGHAKAICLNFGVAAEFGGVCNLRFDDTNPTKEEVEYVEAIKRDVQWLGWDFGDRVFFASDYFEQLYGYAEELIEKGLAYVDSQSADEIRDGRGNFYRPGLQSPYRERAKAENLDLFRRMRAGEFPDGAHVLRAKIDMQHPNMNMRDPPLYRIRHATHHRTGDAWCIYPMYDFAHGQSDAIEGVTHSLCSLEFENHRPLYDWFIDNLELPCRPRQYEFARLNLTYTVMSKRRLLELVKAGHVTGWDDPRMPTLCGLRRAGVPPEALRQFTDRVGVARRDGIVDISLLEHAVRENLNVNSPRVMAVLRPLKVIIDNLPPDAEETFDAPFFPDEPARGSRPVPLCRELYIERDDFREDPPKKWYRLAPGREIRLRYACLITCVDVVKDESGQVVELHCTWDPASRGGNAPDGRKVKGTSHWVSARHAVPAEVRLYDRLFRSEDPMAGDGDFLSQLNPGSLEVVTGCVVEPSLADAAAGSRWQFERLGYFCVDPDTTAARPVFNRTISLRDSWAKIEQKL